MPRLLLTYPPLISFKSRKPASLDPFEITEWPTFIEVGFRRLVEAEVSEPAFACDRRNPVRLETRGSGGPAINIDRAVSVLLQVHPGRAVGDLLLINY